MRWGSIVVSLNENRYWRINSKVFFKAGLGLNLKRTCCQNKIVNLYFVLWEVPIEASALLKRMLKDQIL